jgi:uncharacterized membrane-anchored protein YitT (DUF2179 family)
MKKRILDYVFIALGSMIMAFAIDFFLAPFKISTGGISGLATVLLHAFHLPLSITTLFFNALLFFFGYRTLPKEAIPKSAAGILFLSLFLELFEGFVFPEGDLLLGAIFGGVLVGVGVGFVVMRDGSTGGSDYAALILNRLFPHISIATFILIIDTAVILLSGVAFRNFSIMLYSVISLYISTKVTDFLLIRGDFAKSVTIISPESEKIAAEIMEKMERGVTGFYTHGFYTKRDGKSLVCIVRSREVATVLGIVETYDKTAFTYISDVRKVRGEGF